MDDEVKYPLVGAGFVFVTQVCVFVGLRLSGEIGWSWWWVASPLWMPVALVLALAAAVLVLVAPLYLYDWVKTWAERRGYSDEAWERREKERAIFASHAQRLRARQQGIAPREFSAKQRRTRRQPGANA